jgi:large subunit ribosomal protein L31e
MAEKKPQEPKIELEREYIVPLRKGWLKVPKYKRANKAVKTLKEFIAKHMKVYERDLRDIKVDNLVNNEIRFKGMRKPLSKIKVKAIKYDSGIVRVELVDIPEHVKFDKLREAKKKAELDKKQKEKPKVEKTEEAKEEESEESKEKEKASKEAGLKIAKDQAKELKHTSKDKKVIVQRKALAK